MKIKMVQGAFFARMKQIFQKAMSKAIWDSDLKGLLLSTRVANSWPQSDKICTEVHKLDFNLSLLLDMKM